MLVTALEARSDIISLNYVQQALVREEQKLYGVGSSNDTDVHREDKALVGDSNMSSKKAQKPPTCFGCGQPGHFQWNCTKAKKGTGHKAKTAGEEVEKENLDRNNANAASYEVCSGEKPNIEHLKVFGCIAYSHIPDSQKRTGQESCEA